MTYLRAASAGIGIFCALICALPLRAADDTVLVGGDKALWLIQTQDGPSAYRLAVRPIGGKWLSVGGPAQGEVAAATVLGEQLHLMFAQGAGYLVYRPGDKEPSLLAMPGDKNWPKDATPLALTPGFSGEKDTTSLLAVIPRFPGPATAPGGDTQNPATTQEMIRAIAPGSAESRPTEAPRLGNLAVFQRQGAQWQMLTELPDVKFWPNTRVLARCVGDTLYLLARTPDQPNHLWAWQSGVQQWRELPLEEPLASAPVLGLFAVDERLVLGVAVGVAQGQDSVQLAFMTDTPDAQLRYVPLTLNDQQLTWPRQSLPSLSRLGDHLAIAWRQDKAVRFALLNVEGSLTEPADIDVLSKPQTTTDGENIRTLIVVGIIFLLLIPMFMLRSRPATKPFSLPQGVATAALLKRLIAGMIDLMPFSLLGMALFFPEGFSHAQEYWPWVQEPPPEAMAYASLFGMLAYVVYCILMENRYNATLGKMLFGMRVVGDEAGKPSLRDVAIRNLMKLVEFTSMQLLPLFMAFPILSRYRQRLGDILGRTAVVNAKTLTQRPPQDAQQPPEPQQDQPPE